MHARMRRADVPQGHVLRIETASLVQKRRFAGPTCATNVSHAGVEDLFKVFSEEISGAARKQSCRSIFRGELSKFAGKLAILSTFTNTGAPGSESTTVRCRL